jgi:hypothetical protein
VAHEVDAAHPPAVGGLRPASPRRR